MEVKANQAGFRNLEIFCLWNLDTWVLTPGIQLKLSGMQVPMTSNQESSNWNFGIQCGIQNLRMSWTPLIPWGESPVSFTSWQLPIGLSLYIIGNAVSKVSPDVELTSVTVCLIAVLVTGWWWCACVAPCRFVDEPFRIWPLGWQSWQRTDPVARLFSTDRLSLKKQKFHTI